MSYTEEDMMKRFQWLILFLLVTTFRVSAQNQSPKIAVPSVKLVAVTILVRDYDKATLRNTDVLAAERRNVYR